MHTREGRPVKNLTFVKELNCYVGEVDGKKLTWNRKGNYASKYRSKNDLVNTIYVNVKRWAGKIVTSEAFNSREEAILNKGNGYLKTIEVNL
jgi:hypothetical protein